MTQTLSPTNTCTVNCFNREITCRKHRPTLILTALTAIGFVTAFLSILAGSGIPIGSLNALGGMGIFSLPLFVISGLLLAVLLRRLLSCSQMPKPLPKPQLKQEKPKTPPPVKETKPIETERLNRIFLTAGSSEITQTFTFKDVLANQNHTLYMTDEATIFDVQQKLSFMTNHPPEKIWFIQSGKIVEKTRGTHSDLQKTLWKETGCKDKSDVFFIRQLSTETAD